MDYPSDPGVRLHPSTGKFTTGNPGAGIPASVDKGEVENQVWDELIYLIEEAGIIPDEGNTTQVHQAIAALINAAIAAINAATTSQSGHVELADQGEMNIGTDTARVPPVSVVATYVAAQVAAGIASLVGSSPAALDTIYEFAAALGEDPNFATTMVNALAAKAPLASPALTGNPTAPTQTAGNSSTRIANTAFVQGAIAALSSVYAAASHSHAIANVTGLQTALNAKAPTASPTFTGTINLVT